MGRTKAFGKTKSGFRGQQFCAKKDIPVDLEGVTVAGSERPTINLLDTSEEADKVLVNQTFIEDYMTGASDFTMDIINIAIISDLICKFLLCGQCKCSGGVSIKRVGRRHGLAANFSLNCSLCQWKRDFSNSTQKVYQLKGEIDEGVRDRNANYDCSIDQAKTTLCRPSMSNLLVRLDWQVLEKLRLKPCVDSWLYQNLCLRGKCIKRYLGQDSKREQRYQWPVHWRKLAGIPWKGLDPTMSLLHHLTVRG